VHLFILLNNLFLKIFSLWAESPRRLGGLNFGTNDVGNILAVSGTSLTFMNLSIFIKIRNSPSFLTFYLQGMIALAHKLLRVDMMLFGYLLDR